MSVSGFRLAAWAGLLRRAGRGCGPSETACGFTIPRALDIGGQATKGAWGMSWRQKAMKGVEVCEKLGGGDKQPWIPGFPNAVR